MDEEIKLIGERLKGLREVLEITAEEMAETYRCDVDKYMAVENGDAEPSVSALSKVAKKYDVELDVLMFGEEPHMRHYFLTRKGQGKSIERRKEYKYQSLASGFRGRNFDPFLTQVDPLPGNAKHAQNSHSGHEFLYMIEGSLEVTIGNKVMVLNEGDSIFFDAKQPHAMRALEDKPARFLAIVN